MRRFDALIFDFDGLMIDTESPAYAAWSAIYREHGAELDLSLWVNCVGSTYGRFDPVTELQRLTGRTFDRESLIADKERRKAALCAKQPLLPGVQTRLEEARSLDLKVAVASSSERVWVQTHLERHGLATSLDAIVTREDVALVKPYPDLYITAAARLGAVPARCLVFEDSMNGVRAAKAAGMVVYAVPNPITKALDFREADGVLTTLDELPLTSMLASDVL